MALFNKAVRKAHAALRAGKEREVEVDMPLAAMPAMRPHEAGGALTSSTRPSLNRLLLLRASVYMSIHPKVRHAGWSDLRWSACSQRPCGQVGVDEDLQDG